MAIDIIVSNTAQLLAAIQGATTGVTLLLAPGEYTAFRLNAVNISQGVTITSLVPTQPAVLDGFYITNSSHLTFSDLVFSVSASIDPDPFRLDNSQSVTINQIYAHGDMNAPPPRNGLYVYQSTSVTVTNSVFRKLKDGILNYYSSALNESGNLFEEMGDDGIDGAAVNNALLSNNVFDNFQTVAPNHPDAIQFFTQGTTVASYNITITGNLTYRANGNANQGFFLKDEVGTLPYRNVTISNNTAIGTLYNAIGGYNFIGAQISGNYIGGFSDYFARIFLTTSSNVTAANNSAPIYIFTSDSNLSTKNNITVPNVTDGGAALIAAWRSAHLYFYSSLPAFAVSNGLH
jgi:Right handed beta helix region